MKDFSASTYYEDNRTSGLMTDPGDREISTVSFKTDGSCLESTEHAQGDSYWDTYLHGTYKIKPADKSVIITYTAKSESEGWIVSPGKQTKIQPRT